jgi:hypothetical protein
MLARAAGELDEAGDAARRRVPNRSRGARR